MAYNPSEGFNPAYFSGSSMRGRPNLLISSLTVGASCRKGENLYKEKKKNNTCQVLLG